MMLRLHCSHVCDLPDSFLWCSCPLCHLHAVFVCFLKEICHCQVLVNFATLSLLSKEVLQLILADLVAEEDVYSRYGEYKSNHLHKWKHCVKIFQKEQCYQWFLYSSPCLHCQEHFVLFWRRKAWLILYQLLPLPQISHEVLLLPQCMVLQCYSLKYSSSFYL